MVKNNLQYMATPLVTSGIGKYYHMQIQKKNGGVSYALNLTEDRIRYMVKRFTEDPSDIAHIEISVTNDNSDTILKKEREGKGFFRIQGGTEKFIFQKGKLITSDFVEQQLEFDKKKNNQAANKAYYDPKKIFIVHGHDEGSKWEIANILKELDLEPIILHTRANAGKTIIEKFETHTDKVGYAFILLTPDDIGGITQDDLNPRARQNVIFELGYFIGRLGRERVCCIYKGEIEKDIPSDIGGIAHLSYQNNISECYRDIIKELVEAGYGISLLLKTSDTP